uniref:Uncharacterized protein n=1 Tax=Anopheles atroparvus TaxID=41427 RepID=A0AAG5DWU6_ANOAO
MKLPLRWKAPGLGGLLVVCQLFMSLQFASCSPFFGVSVQGGFQTEADIAVSARAVGVALDASKHPLASFSARLPFTIAAQNVTAGAVLQLYGVLVSRVVAFTDRIAWAVGNTTDQPADVFGKLGVAYEQAVGALGDTTVNATAVIASYSPVIGAQLNDSRNSMMAILGDINGTLLTFQRAITDGFSTPVTAMAVFEKLTKFQIGTVVGALDALRGEVTVIGGKLQEAATILTEADALMASYVASLSQAFSNVDGSLTNLYTTLTRASTDFSRQYRASESTVTNAVRAFRTKLATFSDDVIGAGASNILQTIDSFGQRFSSAYAILYPNVDERLQLLVSTASDTVLNEAQNQLFITYRVLDNVMRLIPTVPTQGRSCALEHISPYVQSLASNLAPALSGCISGTGGQTETVLRVLQQSVEALVRDRLAYVKLWNDALYGVSNTSDVITRRIAYAKLSAQTSNQSMDTLQPALASSFSTYGQLVSNLNAVLNRAQLCVTLKAAELSSQLGAAELNFNACLKS